MKGQLIVIAGTDGSGKATQTEILAENLRKAGKDVEVIEFPQYGRKSAGLAEEYLNGKYGTADEVGPYRGSVFFACDRYDASFKIKKWLEQGKIVISNRYAESNMGHQGGKIKERAEREKFWKWVEHLEYDIFGIPKPDITIFLYVPPEIGQELVDKKGSREYINGKKKDLHEEDLGHLKNASEAYLHLLEVHPDWVKVECMKGNAIMAKEEIGKKIIKLVKEKIRF